LHSAAEYRDAEHGERSARVIAAIVQTLAAVGADVDARDSYGRSALHRATMLNERPPIVAALIAINMDVNARDSNDRTALDFAQNPAVIAALRAAGAVCGGTSEFTDGSCQPGAQAAATSEELNLMYRELARAQAKFLEQSGVPDSAPDDSLWGTD
jgi:hypothetical protein